MREDLVEVGAVVAHRGAQAVEHRVIGSRLRQVLLQCHHPLLSPNHVARDGLVVESSFELDDLAFNTAVSFTTNTNWQAYSGESSLSNLSQMAVITFLMCISATTGLAAAGGFMRGLCSRNAQDIGNYWVDFTRSLYRLLLPACFLMALVYVWQGMPQTLSADVVVTTLEGIKQQIDQSALDAGCRPQGSLALDGAPACPGWQSQLHPGLPAGIGATGLFPKCKAACLSIQAGRMRQR